MLNKVSLLATTVSSMSSEKLTLISLSAGVRRRLTSFQKCRSPLRYPVADFSHLHVDLMNPLPVSRDGFIYILTVIDRSTRLVESIP